MIDAPLKPSQTRRVLPVVVVVTFLGFLGTNLLIPIMALYASGLGASLGTVGLIISLYSITNTPANILSGWLVDRKGYRIPLLVGLTGSAVSIFGYSLTTLPIHLALVRAIHGVGGGLISPATMSVTADHADEAKKGKAMGFYGMALAAANLVGFALSGVIVFRLGYDALFYFGAIMLAVGAMVSLRLPKSRPGSIMTTRASFGEHFQKAKGLLKRKGLIVSYSSIFAQYFAFGGIVTLFPLYVKNLGMEAFDVGMLLTTFTVMFIILQFPSGASSDRFGRLKPTCAGLGLGVVSLVILPSATTFPTLAAAMALYGVAFGILFPSVSALVADNTMPEERGLGTGIFHALLTAGVAVGALVIGKVGDVAGIEAGLLSSPIVMALALVVALSVLKRT